MVGVDTTVVSLRDGGVVSILKEVTESGLLALFTLSVTVMVQLL